MSATKRETKRNYTLFIVLYFLIYMGDVPGGTYLPLYLRSIGLTEASIGAILAIAPMVAGGLTPMQSNPEQGNKRGAE